MSKVEKLLNLLKKEDLALHYVEISKKYNQEFNSNLTPKAINSLISNNILKYSLKSDFARVSPGFYGLRIWLDDKEKPYKEYIFTREKKDYLDEYIAVFNSELLPRFITRAGVSEKKIDGTVLSTSCRAMHRKEAEESTSVIQLVSVFLICHNKKVLTFKRTKALPEKRLRNSISINFGGHISYDETNDMFNNFDINDENSLVSRELHEEIAISNDYTVEPIGYIYDNTTVLGSQHLGLLHLVNIPYKESVSISEKRFFINPSFKYTQEVRENNELDFWTISLLKFIDKYYNDRV